MSLIIRPASVPENAVLISESQALEYQHRLVTGWDKLSEVWALKYGPGLLGSICVFSGAYINNHYRNKLKLGSYGRLSSYLPMVALPSIVTAVYHRTIIQPKILLQKEKCVVCVQTQSALLQAGFGVIFPLLLGPLSSFMFATRHFTYRMPLITQQPFEVLKLWQKFTYPIRYTIFGFIAFNGLAAMFVAYKEMESFYKIQSRLKELEESYDEKQLIL